MNGAKVNNAGFNMPKSMSSFVANTANTISNAATNTVNTISNAATNIANTGANAMKNMSAPIANTFVGFPNTISNISNTASNAMNNISSPIMESIGAIPNGGPSMGLIGGMGILIIFIGILIMFSKQITLFLGDFALRIRQWLGYTGQEVAAIAVEAKNEATEAVHEIESVVIPDTVNKFIPGKKQVFNVSENHYTYSDAEPLCRALGAELATYEQVKVAWQDGADWCNYGWVKGQGAVYPTQQKSWEKLQTGTDDERLQCGMPGVNGGYFDNPELRFGINCYGDKPPQSEHDLKRLLQGNNQVLTPEAIVQRKKELKYRSQAGQIGVMPFKDDTWSE